MTRPRRPVVAALAAVLAAAVLSGCTGSTSEVAQPVTPGLEVIADGEGTGLLPVADREPAPALEGPTLEGERLDVSSLRGKVVVLNFWASWCAPCRAEAPNLVAVADKTAELGVEFVGVNVKDDRDNAIAFERKAEVPYPSIHDQPGVLLTRFRRSVPQTPPTTLLLDREGRIAGRFIGGVTERELLVPVRALATET